jgi:hypothetical protein
VGRVHEDEAAADADAEDSDVESLRCHASEASNSDSAIGLGIFRNGEEGIEAGNEADSEVDAEGEVED